MVVNLSLLSYNWLIIMLDEHSCIDKVHNCTFRFKCKKDKPLLQTDLWCFCTMISFLLASFQYIKGTELLLIFGLKKKECHNINKKIKQTNKKTTIKKLGDENQASQLKSVHTHTHFSPSSHTVYPPAPRVLLPLHQ